MAQSTSIFKAAGVLALCAVTAVASAQRGTPGQPSTTAGVRAPMDARAATLNKLLKPITIELSGTRMEDVVTFVKDFAGVEIEAMWLEDRYSTGLDKDTEIDLSVSNITVLAFIERVLDKADEDDFDRSAWQFSTDGALEIGPRSRLNKKATLVVYDIREMLFTLPDFSSVPSLDLDAVLQQSQQGGGGGNSGIFGDDAQDDFSDLFPPINEEGADELIDIITTFVEPNEWEDNGGTGGTIRFYKGTLLIKAPDYMHRQLGGYPWFQSNPAVHTKVRRESGVKLSKYEAGKGTGAGGSGASPDGAPARAEGEGDAKPEGKDK